VRIAIIGGTGVDEMECLAGGAPSRVTTRFGDCDIVEARLGDRDLIFVPRHGVAHATPPAQINYRAQIAALKKIGVQAAIGVCAAGSLRTDLRPGTLVILSDFVDLTKHRTDTFFDDAAGPVVHTDLTHPYCPEMTAALVRSCTNVGVDFESSGVYVGVEGPRYETPAEIRLYASWGADVIGMTNIPEVVLAREAGLCYAAIAVVTNLAGGLSPTELSHDEVRSAMTSSSQRLKDILAHAVGLVGAERSCLCGSNTGLVI